MRTLLLISLSIIIISFCKGAYPVALFHGIGDSCSNRGMKNLSKFFSDELGGVYVKCIESAGGISDWFTAFISQARKACEAIKNDPNFKGEFSVVGISQGSLLGRYVIQACDMKGRVKRYVSIGGPQMGVTKFPHCDSGFFCNRVNYLVKQGVYLSLVQKTIGPAGYFRTNTDLNSYKKYSTFLADLNNEKEEKNNEYKKRIKNLEKVVLIKFSRDTMILPKETAWFQIYDEKGNVSELTETEFYKEDWLGIKYLHTLKRIEFIELKGDHLNFSRKDIQDYMIPSLQ